MSSFPIAAAQAFDGVTHQATSGVHFKSMQARYVFALSVSILTLPASHCQLAGYGQTNPDAGAGKDVWSGSNRIQWKREMHKVWKRDASRHKKVLGHEWKTLRQLRHEILQPFTLAPLKSHSTDAPREQIFASKRLNGTRTADSKKRYFNWPENATVGPSTVSPAKQRFHIHVSKGRTSRANVKREMSTRAALGGLMANLGAGYADFAKHVLRKRELIYVYELPHRFNVEWLHVTHTAAETKMIEAERAITNMP